MSPPLPPYIQGRLYRARPRTVVRVRRVRPGLVFSRRNRAVRTLGMLALLSLGGAYTAPVVLAAQLSTERAPLAGLEVPSFNFVQFKNRPAKKAAARKRPS